MPFSDTELFARLDALGIRTRTVRHPSVFTVAEAKAHRDELPGAHTKNLFLKDRKGELWLVVTDEDRPLDLKRLSRQIGAAPLSFGRPALLVDVLGVAPGSVTPFAVVNDADGRVRLVLDAALMLADALNVHPLVNSATTAIAPADLVRFVSASGHEPLIVDLDG
jgi:Ala-tRNA(Pro) deacylase